MDEFPVLYCGNMNYFLRRMRKESKSFFIILEQRISHNQCFSIQQNLFDNSYQSNKKLKYILKNQTISLNNQDLISLSKQKNCEIKLQSFLKKQIKFPVLLVCRYNFLDELKIMGEIQIGQVSKQSFVEVMQEIKRHVTQLRNLQSECKRQVLTEIVQNQR